MAGTAASAHESRVRVNARPRDGLSRFEWAALGVVAVAFLARIPLVLHPDIIWDSGWYLALARSFGDTGTFVMPWTDPPQYNGYWPPLFPIFLAPLVKLFGPSYSVEVVGACLATALLTLATFLCTRDLFGRTRAFAAAALVAANPAFFVSDSRGMSESILALATMLTVWAFLRSLKEPKFLALAGGFAVFAYLGKPNLGAPFIGAGILAVGAWRVAKRGWRGVLRSPVDLAVGGVALVALAAIAILRPVKLGGVGLSLIAPLAEAWLHPGTIAGVPFYVFVFPFKLVFAAGFLAAVTLPVSLALPRAARAWRDERTGALWLSTLIPLVAGAIFTTTFYFTEGRPLVDFDNIRYLTPAIVPAIWLALPFWAVEDDPDAPATALGRGERRRHEVWLGVAAASYVTLLLFSPIAGEATLSRLQLMLELAFVPLVLALVAGRMRYATATKRLASGATETRYIEARAEAAPRAAWLAVGGIAAALVVFLALVDAGVFADNVPPTFDVNLLFVTFAALLVLAIAARPRAWAGVLAVGLVTGAFAYFVSSWYLGVALGLVVAGCAVSRKAGVVVMALVLLGATAPGYVSPFPAPEFAHDIAHLLPAGTTVGVQGPIVYAAAVVPGDIKLREMPFPPPPSYDAILVNQDHASDEVPGFTRVAVWNYTLAFTPTLAARLWIEEHVFDAPSRIDAGPAFALFVRTNSTLYQRLPSS